MKKILFGIFAHPDDEAFGPSGTLLLETRSGTELHLITLTAGENGMNPDNHSDLGAVRLEEWKQAGKLIGAAKMHHFGYEDGTLGNQDHVEITHKIESLIKEVVASSPDAAVEVMTMDLNGITGHIDHIVAARSAALAYYRLKEQGQPLTRLRLACIAENSLLTVNTDFVLMEPGRTQDEITETIDARSVIEDVYAIIRTHHTQRSDGETHIERLGELVALNHFIVIT